MDIVIPIVFPDYLIAVNTPPIEIQLPHRFLGRDVFPPMIRIPGSNNKVPELGHAGVLFIDGKKGITKYFEYGRYDRAALGGTRQVTIPDVVMAPNGHPTYRSLCITLYRISRGAGQGGRISGAYIQLPTGGFNAMLGYSQKRVGANKDPQREPYHRGPRAKLACTGQEEHQPEPEALLVSCHRGRLSTSDLFLGLFQEPF